MRAHDAVPAVALCAGAVLLGTVTSSAQQGATPPQLTLADSVIETFHDSDDDRCGTTEIHFDGPLRAFEDDSHTIHLTVTNGAAKSWQWTGSATDYMSRPSTATLDCVSIMDGASNNPDPAAFDQRTWIQALYWDSPRLYAYGHGDYMGYRSGVAGCTRPGTVGEPWCWYSSIPVWITRVDAPETHFTLNKITDAPDHVAIYPHVQFPADPLQSPKAGWIGYGAPSNIFRGRNADGTHDGNYYMFAYTNSGYANQPRGVCLFRTATPEYRTTWRAWNDGTSQFDLQMKNPYDPGTTNSPCTVIEPSIFNTYLRSVQWHEASGHYIGIYRRPDGVYYTTSTDLLNWNAPQLLLTSTTDEANYPVVIDFDGGDNGDDNFDTIYDAGNTYLYYGKVIGSGHTRITRRLIEVVS